MKTKKYRHNFGTVHRGLPLNEEMFWDEEVVIAAGFDPEDEEVVVKELAVEWNGHPAGSYVVMGATVEGHTFAVVQKVEK